MHPRPLDSTHQSAQLAPWHLAGSKQSKDPRAEVAGRELKSIAMPPTTPTQMMTTMQQSRGFRPTTTTSSSLVISFNKTTKVASFRRLRPPRAAAAAAGPGTSTVPLTVSDAELASRGFAVRRTTDGLDVAALNEVFARVGFPRRDEARLRRALDNSRVVWLSSSEARPVAFARAAGDGVFNAVVWDVVVEPSCQGLGLGRAVMERLVHDLRRDGVSNIVLYAEPRVVGFYRLLDFAMDPDGIRGMAYYRKSAALITGATSY